MTLEKSNFLIEKILKEFLLELHMTSPDLQTPSISIPSSQSKFQI